ncbi:MAG: hypothetical protein NDJ24_10400 [Alphaproteobacteria bacterium]|nr:hypothetical protein [Alphaproteobacteria bacterium]
MSVIFAVAEPFSAVETQVLARYDALVKEGNPMAERYAKVPRYREFYDQALLRLQQLDMLSLEQAALRTHLTPDSLLRKINRGQAVMIEVEGVRSLPDWQFDSRGRVKPLHLAIAREFARDGHTHSYFKFMAYLEFMGDKTLEFTTDLPKRSMKDVFRAVGITQGICQVKVRTPMFEAVDRALKSRVILAELINQMGAALTRIGGMGGPNEGGLSDEFLDKYVPTDIPQRDRWRRELS